jgi:hypothetical protein
MTRLRKKPLNEKPMRLELMPNYAKRKQRASWSYQKQQCSDTTYKQGIE